MALDGGGFSRPGFNHVGIDGALCQKVYGTDFFCLLFKDPNKLFANDFAFLFWFLYTCQFAQETGFCIDPAEVQVPLGKGGLYFVSFVQTQKAVVYKDAGQLISHCFCKQCGGNRRVHTAGKSKQDLAAAHLFSDGGNGRLAEIVHRPVAVGVTDRIEKIADHFHTIFCVVDLWMILYAVEASLHVSDGGVGTHFRMGGQRKAGRNLGHIIPVAHPGDAL